MKSTTYNKNSISRDVTKEGKVQVIVSVKDTGTGIDPQIIPKLFSKFTTKSFDGTGLGLFISRLANIISYNYLIILFITGLA